MEKGYETLMVTYGGGRRRKNPTADDYELAIAAGYMFASAPTHTHDETLCELRHTVERISPMDVANAFLHSLSTRELQYRSALGSYWYARAIPEHSYNGDGPCEFCDWRPVEKGYFQEPESTGYGYNVYNFERYKWGGVRHTHPQYALFDLEQFLSLPKAVPMTEDWNILKSILQAMRELSPDKKAGAYRELITKKKLLKSNKDEVEVLLNILGICGVLSSENAPCYCDCFVDVWHRSPKEHTNDYTYPVNWWYVSDGINNERFQKVFGIRYSDL